MNDIKQIKKELEFITKKLNRCSSNNMSLIYSDSYEQLMDVLSLLGIKIDSKVKLKSMKYYTYKESVKCFFKEIEFHSNIFKEVLNIFNKDNFIDYQIVKCNGINIKDTKEILLGFFSQFDSTVYEFCKNNIKDCNFFTYDDPEYYYGICCYIKSLNKSYIGINQKHLNNPYDFMLTIVHEIGHAYAEYIKSKTVKIYNTNYDEVTPYFFEGAFELYLKQSNILEKQRIFGINYKLGNLLYNYCIQLNTICNTYNNDAYEAVKLAYDADNDRLDDAVEYFYGVLLAIYFTSYYQDNYKECMKDLHNFIFSQGILDNISLFNSLNITDYEFFDKYLEENNKDIRRILIKK